MSTSQVDKQHTDRRETALKHCQKLLKLLFHFPESLLYCSSLLQAFEIQQRVLKRVPLEQTGSISSRKKLAALIKVRFAEHYLSQKDYVQITENSKNALTYTLTESKESIFKNLNEHLIYIYIYIQGK